MRGRLADYGLSLCHGQVISEPLGASRRVGDKVEEALQ